VATGKLATDELEEPIIIDSSEQTDTTKSPQYSSIDSIKEDEECGPSSFSVRRILKANFFLLLLPNVYSCCLE